MKVLFCSFLLSVLFLKTPEKGSILPNDYHKSIHEAELFITGQDYNDALSAYLYVSKHSDLYTIDIHNALVCAILTEDESATMHFGSLLSKKGLPAKYFLEKSIFTGLKNKEYWKTFAENAQIKYDSLLIANKAFLQILDSLVSKEEEINRERLEMLSRHNHQHRDSSRHYESWMRINERALFNLFSSSFFPGENLISQYLINDTALSFHPKFWEVIVHCYQSWYDNIDTVFTSMLKNELKRGNIKPETFAFMQDMGNLNEWGTREYYGTQHLFCRIDNKLYALRLYYDNDMIRKEIEKNRTNTGLSTLHDAISKIKFVQSGMAGSNSFIIYGNVSAYPGIVFDEETYSLID